MRIREGLRPTASIRHSFTPASLQSDIQRLVDAEGFDAAPGPPDAHPQWLRVLHTG